MAAAAARRPWGERAKALILLMMDISGPPGSVDRRPLQPSRLSPPKHRQNLDTTVSGFATLRLNHGCAHDPRGGGDDRMVPPDAALRGASGARRARPLRIRLPPLRSARAAATAHPARAARRA